MRFRQVSRFTQCRRLVAKERGKGDLRAQRSIEIAFALHRALGDLIQVSTHSCHLERGPALVDLVMASFTQRQDVGECILASMLTIDQVMGLQAALPFATLLALIAVPHQAGDTQVLIQSRGILVARATQSGIIQARNVYLDIFYDGARDGKRNVLDDANDLLHIRLEGRRKSPTPFARSTVEKPLRSVPLPAPAVSPVRATILYLVFDILAMLDLA